MKNIIILFLLLMLYGCAGSDKYISINSRGDVTQGFVFLEHEKPLATVILFMGGDGKLKYEKWGPDWESRNFLVRTRREFLKHGFNVLVIDAPSDKQGVDGMFDGFRYSDEHQKDIEAVIKNIKTKSNVPVWLIGTSRGTESAASIAISTKERISGLVLTSSMSVVNRRGVSVTEMSVNKISVPTLIVAHENDGCDKTPPEGANEIANMMNKSTKVEVKLFKGGDRPISKPCWALSYHGFLGIEDKVVEYIANFIKQN